MWEERILFIDGEAIVIDKPAGLAVHPGPRTEISLGAYLHHFRFGFQREPVAVHRLDRDTSGCLLLARNPKALKRFSASFADRTVAKSYVAVLNGVPEREQGTIDLPLAKVSSAEQGWRMITDAKGQSAVTHWRALAVKDGRTLILFEPETGRTHQLRIHAAEGLGVPIVGDPIYGRGGGATLLHARAIKVPRDGKPPVEATAPLPESFAKAGFSDADL